MSPDILGKLMVDNSLWQQMAQQFVLDIDSILMWHIEIQCYELVQKMVVKLPIVPLIDAGAPSPNFGLCTGSKLHVNVMQFCSISSGNQSFWYFFL